MADATDELMASLPQLPRPSQSLDKADEPRVQAELAAALDDAYRALRDAWQLARRVLMHSRAGRLPLRQDCPPEHRWLLEAIEAAERDVDRLRRRLQLLTPAAAARRATAAALPGVLDRAAWREREAARLLGMRAV